ncbi:hypothetical protein [uncultured Neisseria sp.]|uniref:hypothetical protein n=1 Tax=uncultured Neisseria sp. TaxID=237778 RepID=UPI0025E07583|nr:hypothetical protein [uncultured Neisseria sp.]
MPFQHTAARRRLAIHPSRQNTDTKGFNTQPPEGGWDLGQQAMAGYTCFNTQPPEGGWVALFRPISKN